jgi:hypothetical protein
VRAPRPARNGSSVFGVERELVSVSRVHASEGVAQALKRVESFGKHL